MKRQSLILFVKAPVPGRVKTRLVPPLTPEEAARLYQGWAREAYSKAKRLSDCSVSVAYQSAEPFSENPQWLDVQGEPVMHFAQSGSDLGERLKHAFQVAFSRGEEKVVIIGSDSPGLPAEYLTQAFESLDSADVVVGPAQDGGYYLIALSRPIPELFSGISWSTPQVLSQTLQAARRMGLEHVLLPEYFDVDVPEDLARLKPQTPSRPLLSVIVPARNEESNIVSALQSLRKTSQAFPTELIVVDGQSADATAERARAFADQVLIAERRGRSGQMDWGARRASGDFFLFLHADTQLPSDWQEIVRRDFIDAPDHPQAAAFNLAFDRDSWTLRAISRLASWRTRITKVPQGDQALLVRRSAYFAAGGFPDVPLMEEYLLWPKLRELGPVKIFKESVQTSARRYVQNGPLWNSARNSLIVLLFYLGVSPDKLAGWYR